MLNRLAFVIVLMLHLGALTVMVGGVQAQEAGLPPLTEPGPYGVRLTKMTFVDENRGDWQLETTIWYPADKTQGAPITPGSLLYREAPPDRDNAPYPLLIYSHSWNSGVESTAYGWLSGGPLELAVELAHLASQGYVVAAVQHHDTVPFHFELVDRPLDILTVLDELAVITEGDLAGMIDTDNVGLMGYALGAESALQMLGLLSDPHHYASWCAEHPDLTRDCTMPPTATKWPFEELAGYRDQLGLETLPDGSWAPFGDDRIRAVLAISPGDFPLTTEDMLVSVTTPTMILHTADEHFDYEGNAVRTYTHLGTEDRYLITVVNGFRYFLLFSDLRQHFPTAFFGWYLQGNESYAPYLTAENLPASQYPRLVWGPYEGE